MTDKERLEELETKYSTLTVFGEKNSTEYTEVDVEDLVFLIQNGFKQAELVEKLEEEVDRLNGALHFQLSEENIKNERIRKLHRQNRRYLEAIEDIKKTWKNPHNPYNQLDEIYEIIKELEESK